MSEVISQIIDTNFQMENSAQTNGAFQPIYSTYRFNGKNYLNQSQLIQTILKEKEKSVTFWVLDQNWKTQILMHEIKRIQ